ncbi:hypothetical protein QAD02_005953 [Eretmocerus hayati]|uniref:Uncharacterized protein n=1 Tax=Eretmocerus hayati TaxID=131215 RepID=A0ACC2N0C0_9HYME|nr:hypothetical protein QAD02_005953 [Eretmocerus hayati]
MTIRLRSMYFLFWICWQTISLSDSHSRQIFDRAMNFAQMIENVQNLQDSSEKIDWKFEKEKVLQQLYSLNTDYQFVAQKLYQKIGQGNSLSKKMKKIFEYMRDIQESYESFLNHFRNPGNNSYEQRRNFSNRVISSTKYLIKASEYLALEFSSLTKENLIEIARKSSSLQQYYFCDENQSPQQLLYQFYEAASLSDAKAVLVILYAYDMRKEFDGSEYERLKNEEKEHLVQRLEIMSNTVRDVLSSASREISTCPVTDLEDALRLKVFQKYLVHQSDITNIWRSTFDSCPDFKREKPRCDSVSCLGLPQHKRCQGVIRNCETIPHRVDVCFSPLQSNRRYTWVKTENGQIYGSIFSQCNQVHTFDYGIFSKFCFCDCEDERMDLDRHFSLMNVTSDIKENMVVTGAQLVKRNHVIYIQIQQGKLDSNGTIKGNRTWKEFDEVSLSSASSLNHKNFLYTVTYDQNTVQLGEVKAGPNEILTGLRFARVENDLVLQIQKTPFDLSTGKLIEAGTSWSDSNYEFNRKDHSNNNSENFEVSESSDTSGTHTKKVHFRVTNMRVDVGQHTIPFLDAQSITLDTALSGAGLWLRDDYQAAEFLTLKLFNYDLTALI